MVKRSADDDSHDQDRVHIPVDSVLFERVVPALLIVAAVLMVVVLVVVVASLFGVI